jgi:hypothetical protein
MGEWANPWNWIGAFLGFVAAWLLSVLYDAFRPVKDYYVLQRHYFERLFEEPWRGKLLSEHYHGFQDYLAAKAVFERLEGYVLDDSQQEVEHTLFMVPARSKQAAINNLKTDLKTGKAYRKELLLQTPFSEILKRRKYWKEEDTRVRESERLEDEVAREAAKRLK